MASHHGTITEFSGISEDWEAYMEQLESYFVANDITTAAKKRAVLLSSCGTATYKTIRSVVAPDKPTEVAFADLTKKLREHFSPAYFIQRTGLTDWTRGLDSRTGLKSMCGQEERL